MEYFESAKQGLGHVLKHFEYLSTQTEKLSDMVAYSKGNPYACLLGLKSHASAAALISWFREHSLTAFKQWSYVAARLERIAFQYDPKRWYPAYLLLMPLLSDNESLIQWFTHNDEPFDMARVNDPTTAEFHGYQALLALRGDWEAVEARCLRIIGHSSPKMKKYEIDHRFYLALARHDVLGMEAVLQELTSPKVAKVRNVEQAFGFTECLIGTHAVIYAKIAWRHGFRVNVPTPWIPQEWLPISPLKDYADPYDFMKKTE
jgi:Immunity protein 49